ncbi:hypothetical protein ACLB1M_16395 [Escherichia coli]
MLKPGWRRRFFAEVGPQLTIPQQLILPATVRKGIVVNVAEMRFITTHQTVILWKLSDWYRPGWDRNPASG